MATAKDYKVKHPYGATYSPWSKTSPHRGNDRSTPTGTVVEIAGVNCGLTGNTGESSAPHLHTQEGTDPAVQKTVKPANEFKPGTITSVRTTDTGAWGKYFTTKVGSRYVTYAHLSKVNVKVGDVIKEDDLEYKEKYEKAIRIAEARAKEITKLKAQLAKATRIADDRGSRLSGIKDKIINFVKGA